MNSLYDMLNGMQSNGFSDLLARQFSLQQDQAEKAMEALMPAFSQGLKRNVSDPTGFLSFMQALATGDHAKYAQNPMDAFTRDGMAEGQNILSHLFGPEAAIEAIAKQAAQASGLSQEIIKSMMPSFAPIIMGGLFQQMAGQPFGGHTSSNPMQKMAETHMANMREAMSNNPFGRIMEEMLKGGFGMPQGGGSSGSPTGKGGNPWGDILEQMMGGGQPRQSDGGHLDFNPQNNPLGKIFEDMLKGRMPGTSQETARPPQPDFGQPSGENPYADETPVDEDPYEKPKGGLEDLFGEMFDTGREVNKRYEENIESIFDEFLGPRR